MTSRAGGLRRAVLVLLVGLLLFGPGIARWYTEWLWFGEVGYRAVFWVPVVSSVIAGCAAALAVFLILFTNVRPLLRLRPIPKVIELRSSGGRAYRQVTARLRPAAVTAIVAG